MLTTFSATITVRTPGDCEPPSERELAYAICLGADFPTSSGSAVNVTGLAFTPAANKTYEFRGLLLLRTATATVGARPGLSWPSGA